MILGGPLPPHPLLQGWPQEAQASGKVPVQLAELEGSLRAGAQRGEELARAHTALPQTGLLQSRPQAPRQHRLRPWQSESLEQRCCVGLRQRRRSSGHLPILTATQGPGESCRCPGPGAWGLAGGQHGGQGPLPETFRTHWRKHAWRQHFIPEGHWLSCRHWSGTERGQGPSSGGQPPDFSVRELPRFCHWRQFRIQYKRCPGDCAI